jgi:hypothetical protein
MGSAALENRALVRTSTPSLVTALASVGLIGAHDKSNSRLEFDIAIVRETEAVSAE